MTETQPVEYMQEILTAIHDYFFKNEHQLTCQQILDYIFEFPIVENREEALRCKGMLNAWMIQKMFGRGVLLEQMDDIEKMYSTLTLQNNIKVMQEEIDKLKNEKKSTSDTSSN